MGSYLGGSDPANSVLAALIIVGHITEDEADAILKDSEYRMEPATDIPWMLAREISDALDRVRSGRSR